MPSVFTNQLNYVIINNNAFLSWRVFLEIIKFDVNDILELKKPHPCGNKNFRVLRTGSVVRIICTECGRDMNIDRLKLEKSIKKVIHP